jgi:hypothetical protein
MMTSQREAAMDYQDYGAELVEADLEWPDDERCRHCGSWEPGHYPWEDCKATDVERVFKSALADRIERELLAAGEQRLAALVGISIRYGEPIPAGGAK